MSRKKRPVPLFIHAMFRSGSTYAFSKFRENSNHYSYYEPFHHSLIEATPAKMKRIISTMDCDLRHPELGEFYFDEFPFRKEGGARHFRKEFVADTFCLEPNERHLPLKRYLDNLFSFAAKNAPGRRVVMQFCQSSFRMKWLKRSYLATDAYLVRSPRDQWESGLSVPSRSIRAYYLMTTGKQLDRWWTRPLMKQLGDLPVYDRDRFYDELNAYMMLALTYTPLEHYMVFYHLWLQSLIEALNTCDVVIDMNRISRDRKARRKIEGHFHAKGIAVDLSDCKIPSYSSYTLPSRQLSVAERLIEDEIRRHRPARWQRAARRLRDVESTVLPSRLKIFGV